MTLQMMLYITVSVALHSNKVELHTKKICGIKDHSSTFKRYNLHPKFVS